MKDAWKLILLLVAVGAVGYVIVQRTLVGMQYSGWFKYTDEDDNYLLKVPPGWSPSGNVNMTWRETIIAPEEEYTASLATLVYFSVMVKDKDESNGLPDQRAEEILREMTDGKWKNLVVEKSVGELGGSPAIFFDLEGLPYYSSHKLRGNLAVVEKGNRIFALFTSTTDTVWDETGEKMRLMRNSIRFE